MHLIITRHGETIENVKHICQGQIHGTLTKKGIVQAKQLGLKLKNKKIDAIYSSDLNRSIDTAKEILKYHSHLKIVLDKRIRERFVGKYEGKIFPQNWDWNNLPTGVETDKSMCIRAKKFLKFIEKKYLKDETIVVASHNGMIKALLTVIYNKPVSDFGKVEDSLHTSVYEFEVINGKYIQL